MAADTLDKKHAMLNKQRVADIPELLDAMENLIRIHGLYYGEPLHYEYIPKSVLVLMVKYGRMEWLPGCKGERARFTGEY